MNSRSSILILNNVEVIVGSDKNSKIYTLIGTFMMVYRFISSERHQYHCIDMREVSIIFYIKITLPFKIENLLIKRSKP